MRVGEIPPDAQDNIHAPVTRASLLVDNLTFRQLRTNGEIRLPNNDRVGVEWSDSDDCDSPAEPMNDEPVAGPSSLRDFSNTPIPISDESKKWMTERERGKPKPRWHILM
ncbi:hypothetical protein JTB14_021240 [Gonioctena quinquepunctata]|nr:hypothetical protein JTB14_021240 [Gonioctena quinquepunctata]